MPGPLDFLFGKSAEVQQLPTQTPGQQDLQSQILGQLGPLLQRAGGGFEGYKQEATRRFEQQGVPSILERLTSMGGGRSSAVGQQLGGARANLESQLAGQEGQFDQQLLQMLLGSGMQPGVENLVMPEQQGLIQALLTALAGGAGQAAGAYGGGALGGLFNKGASATASGLGGAAKSIGGLAGTGGGLGGLGNMFKSSIVA